MPCNFISSRYRYYFPVINITRLEEDVHAMCGKLTGSVCTLCPPCNPTGSGASLWCRRLAARPRPRWLLAEPLERHPDTWREGGQTREIWVLKCCVSDTSNSHKLRSLMRGNIFWISLYLPQSSCALLLVDVDKVSHHTALDHISLSLHADLRQQTEA